MNLWTRVFYTNFLCSSLNTVYTDSRLCDIWCMINVWHMKEVALAVPWPVAHKSDQFIPFLRQWCNSYCPLNERRGSSGATDQWGSLDGALWTEYRKGLWEKLTPGSPNHSAAGWGSERGRDPSLNTNSFTPDKLQSGEGARAVTGSEY